MKFFPAGLLRLGCEAGLFLSRGAGAIRLPEPWGERGGRRPARHPLANACRSVCPVRRMRLEPL